MATESMQGTKIQEISHAQNHAWEISWKFFFQEIFHAQIHAWEISWVLPYRNEKNTKDLLEKKNPRDLGYRNDRKQLP